MDMLDINKRLGVTDEELDDFESKADMVAKLVAGLADGSLNPEDVKIPGEKSEAEMEAAEQRKKETQKEKLREEKKSIEKERKQWWERAEILQGVSKSEASALRLQRMKSIASSGIHQLNKKHESSETIVDDDGKILFPKPKGRNDALDYSVWDKWIPDDPVSLKEMQSSKAEIETLKNRAFEAANPEFCKQFKEDQETREKKIESSEKAGEKRRLRGNQYFKRKMFKEALSEYREALVHVPLNVSVLCNMSQVYLMMNDVQSALEYTERALFIDSDNVKALWRHARACVCKAQLDVAVHDLEFAHFLEPDNSDISDLLQNCKSELAEELAEAEVAKALKDASGEENAMKLVGMLKEGKLGSDIGLQNRICNEIVSKGPQAKLALASLLESFETCDNKFELAVLVRSTGVLDALCIQLVTAEEPDEIAGVVLFESCFASKLNTQKMQQYKVLDHLYACMSPSVLGIIDRLSNQSLYASEVATKYLSTLFEFIKDKRYRNAATLVISNLAMLDSKTVCEFILKNKTLDVLCDLLAHPETTENAAAAIANVCQNKDVSLVVDVKSLLLKFMQVSNTPVATSYLLAALVNISNTNCNRLKEFTTDAHREQFLKYSASHVSSIVSSRACSLLSKTISDTFTSSHPNLELCLIDRSVEKEMKESVVRCIATVLRQRHCLNDHVVDVLVGLLETQSKMAKQGDSSILAGNDILTSNLTQCFVQISGFSADSEIFRTKVTPAIITLLQYVQDGSTRKNCAIALAKIAKASESNMQVVRSLRGMEMLVELGGRFV